MFVSQEALARHIVLPARTALYRFEAQLELHAIGIVPEGLRMANRFEGRVVRGLLTGARVWGIDHFVIRNDGVGLIDAEKTLSLGDLHVHEHVRAYCLPPQGLQLPPLEALLEPGFEWPDLEFPMHGFSFFRAAHPELAALNRAVAYVEGHGNFRSGALSIETSLVAPPPAAGPPDPRSVLDSAAQVRRG